MFEFRRAFSAMLSYMASEADIFPCVLLELFLDFALMLGFEFTLKLFRLVPFREDIRLFESTFF